ncbi:capsid protein [Norovirus swine/GII/OH-QW125/03/US]|uniref:Capsid protein n=2 Tax=Norovirus GII isolates TaxID=490043 RepID=Q2VTJ7_NORV|nr:capsid protein [Norovirus swine/GII/OH-QW125/03/US]
MMMASNDATAPTDGAAGLVPEVTNETMALEPVAGAALAAPVVGQHNVIDPWIRGNFVQAPNGEFTVSPRNSPGEVLLNLELGPELNPYLAHLARMYNGYAGGMEVQVVLAGNAFAAGKIIFAAVPPSFPVDALSAPTITMCPHVIVDVRQLEPVLLPMPDVRNNFFHYNQSSDPKLRLVAMLYTPLRANSPTDDVFTVSCRVLTRPSPDFEFTFLIPPTVESKSKPFTIPQLTLSELSNSRFPAPIDMLYTSPNDNIVVQPQNGRCTLGGELQGTTQLQPSLICSFRGVTLNETSRMLVDQEEEEEGEVQRPQARAFNHEYHLQLQNLDGTDYDPAGDLPATLGAPDFIGTVYGVVSQRTTRDSAARAHEAKITTSDPRYAPKLGSVEFVTESTDIVLNDQTKFTPVGLAHNRAVDYKQWELPHYAGELTANTNLAPPVAPVYPGEQLLFFRSNLPLAGGTAASVLDCLLPQEWIQHFYQESFAPQSDIALLRYVNPDTGRVLFEAKLHRQGYITVAGAGTSPVAVPPNGYFRFESWVSQFYTLAPMGSGTGRRRNQ